MGEGNDSTVPPTPAESLLRRVEIAKDHLTANIAGVPSESGVLSTVLQFILEILPDVISLFSGIKSQSETRAETSQSQAPTQTPTPANVVEKP